MLLKQKSDENIDHTWSKHLARKKSLAKGNGRVEGYSSFQGGKVYTKTTNTVLKQFAPKSLSGSTGTTLVDKLEYRYLFLPQGYFKSEKFCPPMNPKHFAIIKPS